jgi:hypothetical protein
VFVSRRNKLILQVAIMATKTYLLITMFFWISLYLHHFQFSFFGCLFACVVIGDTSVSCILDNIYSVVRIWTQCSIPCVCIQISSIIIFWNQIFAISFNFLPFSVCCGIPGLWILLKCFYLQCKLYISAWWNQFIHGSETVTVNNL